MKVNLKCFSKLVNPDTCDFNESTTYDLDAGHTVKDLLQRAGIAGEEGDRVGLAPAVGGM